MVHPYTVFKGGIKTIFNVCLYFRTTLHSTISTCGFCKDKHPVMGSKCDERMIMMMTFKQYWVTNGLTGVSTPQESRMIAIHMVLNYKFLDTDVSTQLARWYLFHHFCFRTPKLSQIASSWNETTSSWLNISFPCSTRTSAVRSIVSPCQSLLWPTSSRQEDTDSAQKFVQQDMV